MNVLTRSGIRRFSSIKSISDNDLGSGLIKTLNSVFDSSKNYVIQNGKRTIECRYVRRDPKYISTYLSSHTGCVMGCKFCWLTETRQTSFQHVSIDDYVNQLDLVLSEVPDEYKTREECRVNVNFMARGEPCANRHLINSYQLLYDSLQEVVNRHEFGRMKMNVSTIFPYTLRDRILHQVFADRPVNLYYSIYSINERFRKVFLPNAMPVKYALDQFKVFQELHNSLNTLVFHCAFIEGENDNLDDVKRMADMIRSYQFRNTKFNLVRLNPYSNKTKGVMNESTKLQEIFTIMNDCVTNKLDTQQSRIVNRVGSDVYASCGMFYDQDT